MRAVKPNTSLTKISVKKKPYTAITVQIDRLTSEQYEEDDISGVFDLVEVIRIQSSGPTEAARALRKKLKYGNAHRQIRALTLLDGLVENGGSRFQRVFVDEPLLERLRLLPRDETTDAQVRKKCQILFVQWSKAYRNTPGLERIANLYKELPKTQRPQAARQRVLQQSEDVAPEGQPPAASVTEFRRPSAPSVSRPVALSPTSSSTYTTKLSKSKKSGASDKPINISRYKSDMTEVIAQSSIASTNLLNGLQLVNRETERVSDNPEIFRRFEAARQLRRRILWYIQHVESDDWIGSLVYANDELVKALTAYDIVDRSIDDDSDSDAFDDLSPPPTSTSVASDTEQQLAGLSIQDGAPPAKPPRPGSIAMPPRPSIPAPMFPTQNEGEEDDNPFGDDNAAPTPYAEKAGLTWREV